MGKLDKKVVFITGGNSGIGKASALEAAKEGAIVVVADLASVDHEPTIKELTALGTQALFVPIDVSDVESVKAAINTTVEKFGRLDVALNNAGIGSPYHGVHDMPEEVWHKVININLTGQFYCVKYELQQFLKQGGGVIVNLSSLAGLVAEPGLVPYTAAKHGVLGITKNVAVQYGHQNIRANAICPYYIDTPLLNSLQPELKKQWEEHTPIKRLGHAEEVAKAFIYFASDDSSYCNGSILTLDGGVLAGG
ncbi:SDR family NAD(P)-dependent oxidoreductase [Chitinophaga arvensicola]|uniref:NAD(P)-dependent dehydrogenase, short-chain alcohol dehydrogenase family n=1 Tax=Chitinophaga arvensicola TaxID=29529 RepID=A0A1I0PZI5_9BACT|nr:glucose 1-dehydrogenase [Chitinophaga arvensicola]SEW20044.1 NAD(P)-dependent dehydrogenase, short-chain alcohol dehydrogenase family [Chitinophaga arvensicola]